MSDTWVVNASPLISLARVDHLALLEAPGRLLHIPDAVIASAAVVLRALRDAGMRLDDRTIAVALERSVGEVWKA